MMGEFYRLEGRVPVPTTLADWSSGFSSDSRRVARTEVTDTVVVSTVFLGLDHSFGHGPPLLFETMVFGLEGESCDNPMHRTSTWEEAEATHAVAVDWVKARLELED